MQRVPHPAVLFQIGLASGNLKPEDVAFKRLWAPGPKDVIISGDIKSSYLHSLNAGVLMTFLNIPFYLWDIILKPLFGQFVLLFALMLTRIIGGFKGKAHAVAIDEEHLHAVIRRQNEEAVAKQGALLSGLLASRLSAPDGEDGEITARILKVENGKVVGEQQIDPPAELVEHIKKLAVGAGLAKDTADQADPKQ